MKTTLNAGLLIFAMSATQRLGRTLSRIHAREWYAPVSSAPDIGQYLLFDYPSRKYFWRTDNSS